MSIYLFVYFCIGSKVAVFVLTKHRNTSSLLVRSFDSLQSTCNSRYIVSADTASPLRIYSEGGL